jgi:cystathionine gamma-synthase/methionine-gamma-lyase
MTNLHTKSFATRAVHAGERVKTNDYTPVATPIHPSVGFVYEDMDDLDSIFAVEREGFVYPRYGSPTVEAFEKAVANLEGAESAFAFSSGMAAIHIALLASGVKAGASIVCALDLYGATYTLVNRLMTALGAKVFPVDSTSPDSVEAALRVAQPVAVLVETISNPLLKISDIPALTALAHRYGAKIIVDNTFVTPYLYRPVEDGADFVVHSATKYLAGHGDVMAGVLATSAENRRLVYETNKLVGSVLGPFEAWLALRGLKTLPLRVRQQCDNASQIAEWLVRHPAIERVNYPGLPEHPQHALAGRLMCGRGYGGMLSFEIRAADRSDVFRFMERLELCLPATTLGDIYSLVLHPASTSHRSLSPAERELVGIREGLVRLSAGIEDSQDIIADLSLALEMFAK